MGVEDSPGSNWGRIALLLVVVLLVVVVIFFVTRQNNAPAQPEQAVLTEAADTQSREAEADAVADEVADAKASVEGAAAADTATATDESTPESAAEGPAIVSPVETPEPLYIVSPLEVPTELGGMIAFHSTDSGQLQVHTYDLTTQEERQLVNEGTSFEPYWSPDCEQIVFAANRNDEFNFELYLMDKDGSNQRPLLQVQDMNPGEKDWSPAWSPNGDVIAYQSNRTGGLQVCFATVDGRQLGCYAPGWETALPAWSPTGEQLLFIGQEDDDLGYFHRRCGCERRVRRAIQCDEVERQYRHRNASAHVP